MAGAYAKIIVPPRFKRWELGFEELPEEAVTVAQEALMMPTEMFFERTQEFVHVITGYLKSTGQMDVMADGDEVYGVVEYTAEYAQFEEDRGGEHAFLARGWEAAAGDWADAMGHVWDLVVKGWL